MNRIMQSYKTFRQDGGSTIPRKDYCKVVSKFNQYIMELVLSGDEVKLPEKMGSLFVKGRKVIPKYNENLKRIDNQAPDYQETKKLWERCPECAEKKQLVFHLNEHTNYVRYKFMWSKEKMIVENKIFYTMIFTRTNKRVLSTLIQGGKDYYIEPTKY